MTTVQQKQNTFPTFEEIFSKKTLQEMTESLLLRHDKIDQAPPFLPWANCFFEMVKPFVGPIYLTVPELFLKHSGLNWLKNIPAEIWQSKIHAEALERRAQLRNTLPRLAGLSNLGQVARVSAGLTMFLSIPLTVGQNYFQVKDGKRTVGAAIAHGTSDVGISFIGTAAGLAAGAQIGVMVGSVVPILGNAVGLVAGCAIGYGVGYFLGKAKNIGLKKLLS